MRVLIVVFVVCLVDLAGVVLNMSLREDSPGIPIVEQEARAPAPVADVDRSEPSFPTAENAASEAHSDAVAGCLDAEAIATHEWIQKDRARLAPVLTDGEAIAAYRSVDRDSVRAMAEQGDSAAMVVLGAMSMADAFGQGPEIGVTFLLNFGSLPDPGQRLDATAQAHVLEAGSWFYQAALHGRLGALREYGRTLRLRGATPVSLGWLSEQTYADLDEDAKATLEPHVVFASLMFDITPALLSGTYGSQLASELPSSDVQLAVRQQLLVQFFRSQSAGGLSPQPLPDGTTPDISELERLRCDD